MGAGERTLGSLEDIAGRHTGSGDPAALAACAFVRPVRHIDWEGSIRAAATALAAGTAAAGGTAAVAAAAVAVAGRCCCSFLNRS